MNPTEVRLNADRTRLSVTWDSGAITVFPAALLRQNARDAATVRRAADGAPLPAGHGLSITTVEPVGNYGLQLAFSDGHNRGIFPWAYLIEMKETGLVPETCEARSDGLTKE